MEFEACIESLEGALLAESYGADRVELCSALHEGGLSPSNALVKQVLEHTSISVFPMIRPVAGGFVYSQSEQELMAREIHEMADLGVPGVVFGLLSDKNEFNLEAMAKMVDLCRRVGIDAVCHRAFDFTPDPFEALGQVIDLGFKRLLTSGQEPKAIAGLDLIKELHKKAAGRIEIMAGSGVMPENLPEFRTSGIDAVHFTVGSFEDEIALGMGARLISDAEKVKAIMQYK